MHKGSVEAHSAGPSQGSEFIVRLPLAPEGREVRETGDQPSKDDEQLVAQRRRRILVVDDNVEPAAP